jgi:hypothetical protein
VNSLEFEPGAYMTLFGEVDELGRYTDSVDFIYDGIIIGNTPKYNNQSYTNEVEVNGC